MHGHSARNQTQHINLKTYKTSLPLSKNRGKQVESLWKQDLFHWFILGKNEFISERKLNVSNRKLASFLRGTKGEIAPFQKGFYKKGWAATQVQTAETNDRHKDNDYDYDDDGDDATAIFINPFAR